MEVPSGSPAEPLRHEHVDVNGVRLHVVRAGEGRAVVLLHGFPDFWYSWRQQIPRLAEAGFDVLAPDMRGYNTSSKPPAVRDYDIDALVGDVVALVDRTCGGRACLAGHDWGGIVAWYAGMRHPDRFPKLVVVNAPHPAAYSRDFLQTSQWLRSWYGFLFQIPRLPEAMLRARNFRVLDQMIAREILNRDAFAHGEIEAYKRAHSEHGALTAMVNYYRAAFRRAARREAIDETPIAVPTLLLWGDRDVHLCASLTRGLEPWVKRIVVRRFANAGHWLQLDEPEAVSRAMIEWFSDGS
jgi:epoxide hydrolase 4